LDRDSDGCMEGFTMRKDSFVLEDCCVRPFVLASSLALFSETGLSLDRVRALFGKANAEELEVDMTEFDADTIDARSDSLASPILVAANSLQYV
jgi:hypothetical protein